MQLKSILLLEDEPALLDSLEQIVKSQGWQVAASVATIEAAGAFLSNNSCDAAIVDVNLRGATSEPIIFELTRRDIPFIVVSGYQISKKGGLWRNVRSLIKPIEEDDLIRELSLILK